MRDAKLAVETGVDGLDVVIGTSSFLREHSHGKDMAYIEKTAIEVIEYIKSKGLEVRCESFHSHPGYPWLPGQRAEISEVVDQGAMAKSCGKGTTVESREMLTFEQSPARTLSAPTWSTSCLCTGPSTRSVSTVSVSPIPLAALPPGRSTTYVVVGPQSSALLC